MFMNFLFMEGFMKTSIGRIISKSIKEGKWLRINYINNKNQETDYYCSINAIDIENKNFYVDIYNPFKGINTIQTIIAYDNIKKASVVDFTTYNVSNNLIQFIENNISKLKWLEYDTFDDKILNYYLECKKLDVDPYQKEFSLISKIDVSSFKDNFINLSDEQFQELAQKLYKDDIDNEKKQKFGTLAINRLSIKIGSKEQLYVIAYNELYLDIKNKRIKINDDIRINKSFLVGENRFSLSNYFNSTVEEFTYMLKNDYFKLTEQLNYCFNKGEMIDENPYFMMIQRDINLGLDKVYEFISEEHKNGSLSVPLKAFFGQSTIRNKGKVEPNIVLINDKSNIDQVRVVYNAIKNPITYVQGPPGTGKTTTILNVILSLFFNDKTCLICSNNNKPLNGIIEKLKFNTQYGLVDFPILRLGNNEEIKKSLKNLQILLKRDFQSVRIIDEKLKSLKEYTTQNFNNLKDLLSEYEETLMLKNSLKNVEKLLELTDVNAKNFIKSLLKIKKDLQDKIQAIGEVTNKDVLKNIKSIENDPRFLMYLYFNSLKYIKRIKHSGYKELQEILLICDDNQMVDEFNKYIRVGANLKKLLRVFPFIVCTNISCSKLGGNDYPFDMCIMDEAGQCEVATSLIPISKAKKLLLVGDINQLKPVITLDSLINKQLLDKYQIANEYNYLDNSIIQLMMSVDSISPSILLRYHYRCADKIIDFSNYRYYNSKLHILSDKLDDQLEFVDVNNNLYSDKRNSYYAEAKAILDYINEHNYSKDDITIITPFVNQADLIKKMLGDKPINCGTVHTVQGSESKVILFSVGLGLKSSKKTYDWLANNREIINVAGTRAKEKLVVFGDSEVIKAHSKGNDDDIVALVDYVKKNGNMKVSKSKYNNIEIGLSNGSLYENDLFKTISHFCSVNNKFKVSRNVKVSSVIPQSLIPNEEDLIKYYKNAEFDLVLTSKSFFGKKNMIVIELNGGEHYLSKSRSSKNDELKINICKKAGIKIIMLPAQCARSYELISQLLFHISGTIDNDYEDYNLFGIKI